MEAIFIFNFETIVMCLQIDLIYNKFNLISQGLKIE